MKKIVFIFLTFFAVFLYYFLNESYRLSFEAKMYYEMGEYDKAYILAQKAYKIKPYNNMALTVMTQSKIAKEWLDYIKEADGYFQIISNISNKKEITKADKFRIKLMLEILINRYPFLIDSYLISDELYQKTKDRYLKAKEIYERVFKRRSQ